MSVFREVSETHLLETAEPLATNGSTCLCYKVKLYDRWQFIKRLRPELESNSRYVSLFTKEYMVGSRLSHPNLVSYNEMDTSDEGVMMLLDYVEGKTLEQKLADEPLYFAHQHNLQRFCSQVLSCLDYLHSQQVLHLDLKPGNIMITRVNNDVKLIDLGFCRTDCFTDSEGKTRGFDAPEQADNQDTLVDARTDLYAFGQILHEIEKTLNGVGKSMPKRYRQVMEHCLEHDPDKRPPHAADCLVMLMGNRHHWRLAILLTLVALVGMSLLYEPWRKEIIFATRNFGFRNYQWEDQVTRMHILSDEEMTCQVVGRGPIYPGQLNLMIPAKSNFVGREYQVVAIGDSVFLGDTLLETVYLPEGIRQLGAQAFKNCHALQIVNLPNSVTQLGSGCFEGCWNLHNLHLSDKLTELPSRCFVDNSLETVLIPEGVTTLHEDVFVNCSKLHDVSLPTSLSAIGRGVFYMCSSLEEITLPAQVASVGEYCFYYCDKLRDIYCLATTPPQAIATFDRQDIRLHVPPTSIEAYRNHSVWGKFNVMGE